MFLSCWASEITRAHSDWMIFALTMMADYLAIRAFFSPFLFFIFHATSLTHVCRMAYAAALSLLLLFSLALLLAFFSPFCFSRFCFLHSFRRKSHRHAERNDSEVIAFPEGFNSFVVVNFLLGLLPFSFQRFSS